MPHAAPSDEAERALRSADATRDGDPGARAAAEAVYARHHATIDPATPEGSDRVLWLVSAGTFVDPRLEDLFRRAAASGRDDRTREAAEAFLFQFPLRRGDVAGAEDHLRSVLRRLRGRSRPAEIGVINNLARIFVSQGREFEALVLARRAMRLAEDLGQWLGRAVATAREAAALTQLGDWDELADAATRLEAMLPRLDDHHVAPARRTIRTARREVHLARGEHDDARREHAHTRALPWVPLTGSDDDFESGRLEARIALAEGRPLDGAAIVGDLARTRAHGDRAWLTATSLWVRCLAAAGREDEAAVVAQPLLAEIRGGASRRHGTATVLSVTAPAAQSLAPAAAARPFFEAAAALLLDRIHELHSCVRELDELSVAPADDRRVLARYRARFVEEHNGMLHEISRLRDASGESPPDVLRSLATDARLRVCAWCLTLHAADGRGLPVGHLVTDAPQLAVSHGICEECRTSSPEAE